MEHKRTKSYVKLLLEGNYYLFVITVITLLIVFAVGFNNIQFKIGLFVIFLISSLVLALYLSIKLTILNVSTNKQSPLGVISILVGLIFIILKISTTVFGEYMITTNYGYIGMACVLFGVVLELTMLDEVFVVFIRSTIHFVKRLVVDTYYFVRMHWRSIIRYGLDISAVVVLSLSKIIITYLPLWASILMLSAASLYLIVNHYSHIKWFAVNCLYELMKLLYRATKAITKFFLRITKKLFAKLWTLIKKLISKKYFPIFVKELARLGGLALGIYLVVFIVQNPVAHNLPRSLQIFILLLGFFIMFASETLTRAKILKELYKKLPEILRVFLMVGSIFGVLTLIGYAGFELHDWPISYAVGTLALMCMIPISDHILSIEELKRHLKKNYVNYLHFAGFYFGVSGSVVLGKLGYSVLWLVLTIVGYFLFLFAGYIVKPAKWLVLLRTLKKIIHKLGSFTYKLLKLAYRNILLTMLLFISVFFAIYGILLLTKVDLFFILKNANYSVYASMGSGFIIVSIAAAILFVNELKKKVKRAVSSVVSKITGGEKL